mmetsp:Transcript_16129/g.26863  ORF Transcript_16129/g.26863 Transcript_16129/m.26863 type:complete len:127 (-) Transcript_16129:1006-1386(-)
MSSDRPLSVAERIAALQKQGASKGDGGCIGGGGGKKKVSALAGDLSSKLNMNALLAGGAVGISRGGNRPSSANNNNVAVADPSHPTQAMTTKAKDDGATCMGWKGDLHHPPRAMIPPGRRRRRGAR